ncbi:alpha/beta hydrolase family protein [Sphingomonas ginsenosidivorax]|uniref:alpha/beta hydrolase family protein n=1 Tax=Sphingomonas ginsenosidivorax TaxID=862135 RepID=UPI001F5595A9|nr:S9 family peptidase [Sphingomonas ginsenosidivorax]
MRVRSWLAPAALLLATAMTIVVTDGAQAAEPSDAAKRFGARDNVIGVTISPDGKSLAVIQPTAGRGAVLSVVAMDGSTGLKPILRSSGNPERLQYCRWSTNTRLVCGLYVIDQIGTSFYGFTRLFSLNSDGSDQKLLSARANQYSLGIALGGGGVIDWLGEKGDGSALMQRYVLPEMTTGHLTAQTSEGLAVERVDTRTLERTMVEQPRGGVAGYITDGRGVVRIMARRPTTTLGQSKDRYDFLYRRKGSREWLPLTTVTVSGGRAKGFEPEAVDPDLDVVYGLDSSGGRIGVYSIALDGSMTKKLVFERPDADVDQLVQVGRQSRVVGASWVTDKRETAMFDPPLKSFATSLSKALPGAPLASFVDASADEQKLVMFAGADTDPGRFYLFDRASKKLAEILPIRPQLASVKLASVKPISFPAADGTMVPGYLTLPPGSDGKGLPAIVLPHGGPWARDEWNFDWLPQFFANRGYAVLQPNYRGSTGYGDSWFQQNGFRSWKTAVGDIDDGGRWLVKQGIADPAKMAIVGWSYGGYAALQSGAVDPTLFKAIVAVAPVTDFEMLREEWKGDSSPASLDQTFGTRVTAEEGSPARHADRFAAPVLLFHGDRDQNVSIRESQLMASRLRGAGKPVQFVEYKGLDHQLDDDAARTDLLDKTDVFLRTTMKM